MKNATKETTKTAAKTAKAVLESEQIIEGTEGTPKVALKPAAVLAEHGPNAKFPFGIEITEASGISYERFKTAKERSLRMKTYERPKDGRSAKTVDYKPEPELGKPAKPAPAAKEASAKVKAAKAAKPKDDALRVRLYAKGEFYFGKLAAARINGAPYMQVAVKGKTVTLTPTKSEKDAVKVGACHASPVLRAAKLLADSGWSKTTQDLVAKPVGEAGFQVEVK